MTDTALSLRDWLSTDLPTSRGQARAIKLWRIARRLARNRMSWMGFTPPILIAAVTLAAPLLPLNDPVVQDLSARLLPPSADHWFGTDTLGRDVFSRVIYGARPSLEIVVLVLCISAPLGLIIGAAAGLQGGLLDKVLMRLGDVFLAFPRLILALAIAASLGVSTATTVLAIVVSGWPIYARLARAQAVTYASAEFVQAAECAGASRLRILFHHVIPLCLPAIVVRAALDAPSIILITAGLGFLGLSVPPPAPEWGAMVANGRDVIFDQWWIATMPGLFILVLSISFNLIGDSLRDVLDPKGMK